MACVEVLWLGARMLCMLLRCCGLPMSSDRKLDMLARRLKTGSSPSRSTTSAKVSKPLRTL